MEPILVVMAAGLGSRYGGNKQIDTISNEGDIIMDFSLFDARRAGFKKVIFVINENLKPVLEEHLKSTIGAPRLYPAIWNFKFIWNIR